MPNLFGKTYSKEQIFRRVGHLSQVGGVDLVSRENGGGRGVRWLEFRTGTGFIFKVSLDRGMDVGFCEYKGYSLAWIPPTDFRGPWFFEQTDGFGWLRTAMGGLLNTCGLVHIGNPEENDVRHYRFPAIQKETYGVHDRAALIPARLIHSGERWVDDKCILEASGEIIQARVYGENLNMTRRYHAILGESEFTIKDTVKNNSYNPTRHELLYHFNFGFPFIDNGSRLLAPVSTEEPAVSLEGDAGNNQTYDRFTNPSEDWQLMVYRITMMADKDGSVPVAIVNPRLNIGLYIVYKLSQFPIFLLTYLMSLGSYMVCLEPCTNEFGQILSDAEIKKRYLEPGESKTYETEVGILENENQISEFSGRIESITNQKTEEIN